jgi:hypothetical protein
VRYLRQSTSVDLPIGPFLDATDGVTAETGLTITQPDVRLKKNAAAWAQKAAAQTLSHEENGYYEVTLDATDSNTLGHLRLAVNESGAAPVWEDFEVITAAVWDALFSTGNFPANVLAINGVAGAAAKAEQGFTALATGTVAAGSTTTVIKTNITTVGPLNGRAITLTSGALMNVARTIVDHNVGTGDIQVVTLPGTPASGVTVLVS